MRIIAIIALCVGVLIPIIVKADQAKDPLDYPLRDYGAILFMTLLGGFAGWYAKVRKGDVPNSSLFALIGEMATSSLAGLGSFFVCNYLNLPLGLTAAIAGLCGYMGGRLIEWAERKLTQRADHILGNSE